MGIFRILKKNKKKEKIKNQKIKDKEQNLIELEEKIPDLLSGDEKSIRVLCSPDGVNTAPLQYMELTDGGKNYYICNFYIDKIGRTSRFAETYPVLFNLPNTTTKVSIRSLSKEKTIKFLDDRSNALESEQIIAKKNGDSNRYKKLQNRINECDRWKVEVDDGYTCLFEVGFLFSIYAETVEKLEDLCSAFYTTAKGAGIDIVSTYSVHPEAYLSNAPVADMMNIGVGPFKDTIVKYHVLDKNGVAAIFNHTQSNFSHKNGILGGHIIDTLRPALIDPYDKSHDNFNVSVSGVSGVGKSATLKMWLSRFALIFGHKLAVIDLDSSNGQDGEYADCVRAIGGVVYQIKNNSENIINMFDLSEEYEWNFKTRQEERKLYLTEKVNDCTSIIMTMIKNGRDNIDFDTDTFLNDIVSKAIMQLYVDRGIEEGVPDSLYDVGETFLNNKLVAAKIKKTMPTLTDLYIELRRDQKKNKSEYHKKAFAIALAALEVYVRDVIYSEDSITIITADEYERLPLGADGYKRKTINGKEEIIFRVRGFKTYFDGQSTISFNIRECGGVDIDLSQLPDSDRDIAQQIATLFIIEHCVKKNSNNPNLLQKLYFLIDEYHRMFNYLTALGLISSLYRQARKRYVSMITVTQALVDYNVNEETRAILKNSAMKIIFKQDKMDSDFVKKVTPLTDIQLERIMGMGGGKNALGEYDDSRKGELCLIDNNIDVVFIKVDYLKETEAVICETDAENRAKLFKKTA